MNYKPQINEIQTLLHKYYDGETTPADEQLLKELFAVVDIDDLPEGMKADKMMFDGLRALDTADASIAIPEELGHRLELITEPGKSITPWVSIRRYAAIAAAVAVLAIVTFVAVRLISTTESVDLVSTTTVETDTTSIYTAPPVVTTPELLEESAATPVAHAKPTEHMTTSAKPKADITYREVTDIAEARAIATRCAELLTKGNQQTVRVADEVDTQLNHVYQIITNI